MDTSAILASLRSERDRISKAIEALEGLGGQMRSPGTRRSSQQAGKSAGRPVRRRKPLTAAAKKHLSEMMRKRWAERKRKSKG